MAGFYYKFRPMDDCMNVCMYLDRNVGHFARKVAVLEKYIRKITW